jgi:hypothetical protein
VRPRSVPIVRPLLVSSVVQPEEERVCVLSGGDGTTFVGPVRTALDDLANCALCWQAA